MLLQTSEIALNSVANVHRRFVTSFPLRYAARQSRAFSDKHAVFVRFNRRAKFHAATLTIAGAVRNATWFAADTAATTAVLSSSIVTSFAESYGVSRAVYDGQTLGCQKSVESTRGHTGSHRCW